MIRPSRDAGKLLPLPASVLAKESQSVSVVKTLENSEPDIFYLLTKEARKFTISRVEDLPPSASTVQFQWVAHHEVLCSSAHCILNCPFLELFHV